MWEAGDREVLETVIIKQDVKILYEAYKGESHGDGADRDPHEIWIVWDKGTHAEGDRGKLRISRSYVSRDRKTAVGHMREAFCYEPSGKTL